MIEVMLDAASALALGDGVLRILFPATADATRRQVERAEHVALLRAIAESVAGSPVAVQVGGDASQSADPVPLAHPAPTAPVDRPPRAQEGDFDPAARPARDRGFDDNEALLLAAKNDPGVARLLREFGAQVVEIRTLEPPPTLLEESGSVHEEEAP